MSTNISSVKKTISKAKTPLLQKLQYAFRMALLANKKKLPADEIIGLTNETDFARRRFIEQTAKGLIAISAGSLLFESCKKGDILIDDKSAAVQQAGKHNQPKIVIIGAGIAGLNCAFTLKNKGINADIYEANSRTGGRMYTAQNLMAPGLSTELGGEFIDSGHADMLRLVNRFGLSLIDVQSPANNGLIDCAYYFNGRHYSEQEVINAFSPIAAGMQADIDLLPNKITYTHPGNARLFDNISLEQYINNLACADWLKKMLKVAFVTEYGLDAGEQSCINMLYLISTDTSAGKFEVFGESDERYKVAGGNQQVTNALTQQLNSAILYQHKLEAVKQKNDGKYVLTFQKGNNTSVDVTADYVVFALPFTILRAVSFDFTLPVWKRNAINNLGYGTNAKLLLGFNTRVWRNQGYRGNVFTDQPLQLGWDNSELQAGNAGGYTFYSGGAPGVAVGNGSPQSQAALLLPGLEQIFPGATAQLNGNINRMHWPSAPFVKASYACYKTGQFTTIAGAEAKTVDNLYFAGEHCSLDYQGYMNGGAETGRVAAEKILKKI